MPIETVEMDKLIEQFGVGWFARWELRGSSLAGWRHAVIQDLAHGERHLAEDGARADLYQPHAKPLLATAEQAVQKLITERGQYLDRHIREHEHALDKLKGYLGWRALLRPAALLHRDDVKRGISEVSAMLDRERDERRHLRDLIDIHSLPATIEHYGRLDFGDAVWVLEDEAAMDGFPVTECKVVSERFRPACRSVLDGTGVSRFEYGIQPVHTKLPDAFKLLTFRVEEAGDPPLPGQNKNAEPGTRVLTIAPGGALSAYFTRTDALAAREERLARVRKAAHQVLETVGGEEEPPPSPGAHKPRRPRL